MEDAAARHARAIMSSPPARCTAVRELVDVAFGLVGLDYEDYVGSTSATSARPKSTSSSAMRPRPDQSSAGDPRTTFHDLVTLMLANDLRELRRRPIPGPCWRGIPSDVPARSHRER